MKIDRAAVLGSDGQVYSLPRPYRHPDIISEMWKLKVGIGTQGFLTSEDEFVDRKEAMKIARRASQLIPDRNRWIDQIELYTEDMW